jgi:hypothetical protein
MASPAICQREHSVSDLVRHAHMTLRHDHGAGFRVLPGGRGRHMPASVAARCYGPSHDLSADRGSGASGRTRLRAELVSEAQRSQTVIVRETALRNLAHIRRVDKTTKRRRYTSSTLGSSPRSAHAAWDLISRGQPCSPRHPRIVGTAPMITGDFPRMERDIVRHHHVWRQGPVLSGPPREARIIRALGLGLPRLSR